MRNFFKNDKNFKGNEDMSKFLTNETYPKETYKKLNLSSNKIKEISVTPKSKDGKLLFDRKNKDHRYIVDAD